MIGNEVARGIAKQADDAIRREIERVVDGGMSDVEIQGRCVMHVYPDGVQELLIDGSPRLRLGPVSVVSGPDGDGNYKVTATRSVTRL